MSGIKIQPSSKKMWHKRRSHAFHLTLFVDPGLTRKEVNPEMKCQGQVSPLRHILLFEAKLYSCYHPSEENNKPHTTMRGRILHRFNCTSRAARGGGGSFKNRKPIGDICCCDSSNDAVGCNSKTARLLRYHSYRCQQPTALLAASKLVRKVRSA